MELKFQKCPFGGQTNGVLMRLNGCQNNVNVRINILSHLNLHQPWITLSRSFHRGNYLAPRNLYPLSNMSVN